MTDSQSIELLELAKRCEDRALYNTNGDPMRLLKEAAEVMRRHARAAPQPVAPDYATTPEEAMEAMRTCPYWNGEKTLGTQENDDVFPGFRGNNDSG